MAELRNTCKKTLVKKSDFSSRSLSNILCAPANQSRVPLPGSKVIKKTCTSLEIENSPYEEYSLEYSTYLLKKAQNRLLAQNKLSKVENVKKCFVSLKLEFEELLNKYLKLNKELMCFELNFDIIREASEKIHDGNKLLEDLSKSKFDHLLKTLSSSLDNFINELQLVDIDKKLIEEMFEKTFWGSGCVLEGCLKKVHIISENKNQISNIAEELKGVRQLWMENLNFNERFASFFKSFYVKILETNYDFCVNVVRKAFIKRKDESGNVDLRFVLPELDQLSKIQKPQHTLELSKSESFAVPRSSSTPQSKST